MTKTLIQRLREGVGPGTNVLVPATRELTDEKKIRTFFQQYTQELAGQLPPATEHPELHCSRHAYSLIMGSISDPKCYYPTDVVSRWQDALRPYWSHVVLLRYREA